LAMLCVLDRAVEALGWIEVLEAFLQTTGSVAEEQDGAWRAR
jgi:hypothetical protein